MTAKKCAHTTFIKNFSNIDTTVCKECILMGDTWIFLRQCRICGNVACCDSSKNKHATKHFKKTKHPIITNLSVKDDGGEWSYCYIDKIYLD